MITIETEDLTKPNDPQRIIYTDGEMIYGYDERFLKLPIANLPADCVKVNRIIRNDDIPKAWIKLADGGSRLHHLNFNADKTAMLLETDYALFVNQPDP